MEKVYFPEETDNLTWVYCVEELLQTGSVVIFSSGESKIYSVLRYVRQSRDFDMGCIQGHLHPAVGRSG